MLINRGVMFKMKKIVITGATGLVGFNLLSIIDGDKYNIIAIDKNKNNLKLSGFLNL